MKIRLNKEIEFLFKKILPDKYLLKKRLIRAIKNNYEEELSILDKIVNKDLESVDVGVYRGVYSYKLSKISKHVHSIEPNPLIFPYLERNLKKIINNITLYNYAASDKDSETQLKIAKRFNTINSKNFEEKYKLGSATMHIFNNLNDEDYENYTIQTKKLDDLLKNKKIGFIKIDVEGHEKNVLNGASELLKKNKPTLLVEIEEKHSKENVINTINYINEFGYRSYYCSNKELLSTENLNDYNKKNNYIFIP